MTDDATTDNATIDDTTTSESTAVGETAVDKTRDDEENAAKLVVTGTPGTGKTTATEQLAADTDAEIIHLNDAIREFDLYSERDADRDSLVTDLDAVRQYLGEWTGVLESHLAHHVDADRVVVLRCEPSVLATRLRERGDSEPKARENAESEALDGVLSEAVEQHGPETIYEIDTTDREPSEVAGEIAAVRAGEREPGAGQVDFTEYLLE